MYKRVLPAILGRRPNICKEYMRVKQPNGGVSRQEQGSTEIECGTRHLPQTQSLYKVFYFNQPNEVRHVRFRPTLQAAWQKLVDISGRDNFFTNEGGGYLILQGL